MRIHYLQHVPFEGLGSIAGWAGVAGHAITSSALYRDAPLPSLDAFDWLLILGGPMSVNDEGRHPWLADEKRFIERAIGAGKTVLGLCLGAQLMANALGAKVQPNRYKEIGWFPVQRVQSPADPAVALVFPEYFEAYHWHGETFDIPDGAVHMALSAACPNQAFVYNERAVALQFHLETTPESAQSLIDNCRDELVDGPFIQRPETMVGNPRRFQEINAIMDELLDALVSVSTSAP
jgi:GMP synthase (glutamine-hydrolysing)